MENNPIYIHILNLLSLTCYIVYIHPYYSAATYIVYGVMREPYDTDLDNSTTKYYTEMTKTVVTEV